jgi:hypothetical protein
MLLRMNHIGGISLCSLIMMLLFLTGSSSITIGYEIFDKRTERLALYTGFAQGGIIISNNYYYDGIENSNYVTISTENNEENPVGDLCMKLLEDCKMPATDANTSATKESDDEDLDIINKYLDQGSTENKAEAPTIVEKVRDVVSKNDTGKQVSSATGELQVYENSDFGIKILYPTGWQHREDPNTEGVRFTPPRDGKNDTYVRTIDLFTYRSMSMNEAKDSLTSYYNESLKNFTANGSPRTSINGNYSSVFFNYTYTDDSSRIIRSMDFIVSPQAIDKTYLFTFRDDASRFDKDLPEIQRMLASIDFVK